MPNCLFHHQTAAHFSMALSLKEVPQSVFLIESESRLLIKRFFNKSNGFLVCTVGQAAIQCKYASLFIPPALGQAIVWGVSLFCFVFILLFIHPCVRES